MRVLGVSCLNHDAAISVIEDGEILFAAHSERYSRIKFDELLNDDIVNEALSYGEPDKIAYFEHPWHKKLRQIQAGQYREVFQLDNTPKSYLKRWFDTSKITYTPHHLSHAAGGYFTSPYDDACIVAIDAIGEWDTISVWYGKGENIIKRHSVKYPHSLGLFYSAITKRLGLKPQEDEYITMGMAAWGNKREDVRDEIKSLLECNLHCGLIDNWSPLCYSDDHSEQWKYDIAANAQWVLEKEILKVITQAKLLVPESNNLVYSGGVALNCVANEKVAHAWNNPMWIMPNPGDSGSSLGCAASTWGKHVQWEDCFLGTDIKSSYKVTDVVDALINGEIVGIASGRAEFGPRALGNRSLLADPRGSTMKDRVNEIKKRQKFRPFSPVVMESRAHLDFNLPVPVSPYMQFTAKCLITKEYPAVCHVDGSSRVQTVNHKHRLFEILKQFHDRTGCLMLLNTSLNIKGQPMVNTASDAQEFKRHHNVTIF